MRLYIVRHAIAVPHGAPGVAEDDRPLTEEGIKKMKKGAAGLKSLGVFPDLILSSPLPRAKQTAEIALATIGGRSSLKLLPALAPSGKRKEVYQEIQVHENLESLMLVGHQPSLGEIAGEITWGSPDLYVEFKKGGACAIDLETVTPAPRGILVWLLTPVILRELAP